MAFEAHDKVDRSETKSETTLTTQLESSTILVERRAAPPNG